MSTPTVTVRAARPAEVGRVSALARATFPDACPPEMAAADIEAFMDRHLSEAAFTDYLTGDRYLVLLADMADTADAAEGPDAGPLGSTLLGYTLVDWASDEEPPAGGRGTDGPGPAYLSKMYVSAAARGTGAATVLMEATLEAARERGHPAVWLGVNRANARANAFYERLGFAVVGERSFAVGDATGHDFLRWRQL